MQDSIKVNPKDGLCSCEAPGFLETPQNSLILIILLANSVWLSI